MNGTSTRGNSPDESAGARRERALRARKAYCSACEEKGVEVCSWENFPAWQDFVAGKIGESELNSRAKGELNQFTGSFTGHAMLQSDEGPHLSEEERAVRERARHANGIYKRICSDSGLERCFFTNFSAWSDYVNGKIGETEFSERSMSEVEKMVG